MRKDDLQTPAMLVFIRGKRLGAMCDSLDLDWHRWVKYRKQVKGKTKTVYYKGVLVSEQDAPKVRLKQAIRARGNYPVPDEFVFIPFKHRHLAERCKKKNIFFCPSPVEKGIYVRQEDKRKVLG